MKKIILDTNAYSAFLKGEVKVLNVLSGAETVYMSIIVIGELLAGFKGGSKEPKNRENLHRFLDKPTVSLLDATIETSEVFAIIKNTLKRSGTPIPINDVWIAAHAMETGSVLVTYDEHFKNIPGLRLWDEMAL